MHGWEEICTIIKKINHDQSHYFQKQLAWLWVSLIPLGQTKNMTAQWSCALCGLSRTLQMAGALDCRPCCETYAVPSTSPLSKPVWGSLSPASLSLIRLLSAPEMPQPFPADVKWDMTLLWNSEGFFLEGGWGDGHLSTRVMKEAAAEAPKLLLAWYQQAFLNNDGGSYTG